jgi:hypothetical protein
MKQFLITPETQFVEKYKDVCEGIRIVMNGKDRDGMLSLRDHVSPLSDDCLVLLGWSLSAAAAD